MKAKKPTKKPPKKAPKPPSIEVKPASDIDKLRAIARAMLAKLEAALAAEPGEGQQAYEWLFGSKQPLISTLTHLSELLLKLDDGPAIGESAALPLTDADVALVQEFITRHSRESGNP